MRKRLTEEQRKRNKYLSSRKWIIKNREKVNEYARKWKENNTESVRETQRKYRLKNKDKKSEYRKKYYQLHKEREKLKTRMYYQKVKNDPEFQKKNQERAERYYRENKEIIIKKQTVRTTHRRRTDIKFRLTNTLRKRVWEALKNNRKSKTTMKLVGCDIDYLMKHLEQQFKFGMSWQNYGSWHVDHIKPCASFDLSLEEEQEKCFHYSNLQPLWAQENLRKGYKYERKEN